MILTQQLEKDYTVDGKSYHVHITAMPMEDGFYRTNYRFRYGDDERDTNFYCVTSEHFEVVFRYLIEAREMFGEEWKKRLKFDFRTKQLFLDDQPIPV
ncbi:MAG: hypothetical protein PUC32_06905 [Oscillospiraceae bacterium]|nr:hypothetical protein [Oscillospiraceae bacterium]